MVNSIGKPTDTYVSTSSIVELRKQHDEIAKCLKEANQVLFEADKPLFNAIAAAKQEAHRALEKTLKEFSLSRCSPGDVKDQAEMLLTPKCAELFHRVVKSTVLNRIFSFLPLENLARISRVSKKWNQRASHMSLWNSSAMCKQFPALKILDEDTWKAHVDLEKFGLETDDIQPLDKRAIIPTLKRLMAIPVEDNAGITLLTIPKGLTLNKLAEIVSSPKRGNAVKYIIRIFYIQGTVGYKACLKTYRVILTNSILIDSRDESSKQLRNLVEAYGCELPEMLPITTLCALTYISSLEKSPTRLFNSDDRNFPNCRSTYTLCSDTLRGFNQLSPMWERYNEQLKKVRDRKIIVGYFDQDSDKNVSIYIELVKGLKAGIGVAAQWKFPEHSPTSSQAVKAHQQVITSHSQPSNASAAANEIVSSSSVSSEERSSDYKL